VRRLRFLRILLPFVLLLFLVLLALQVRTPTRVHHPDAIGDRDAVESAEGVELFQSEEGESVLDLQARLVQSLEDGRLRIEGVQRFLLARDDKEPLVLSAETGDVEGEPGRRIMRFENDVLVRDPEDGLVLTLPGLEVDEAAGEARSSGTVRVDGATLAGTASSLVYGLEGQPSRLFTVELVDKMHGRLVAERAVLYDGLDDVEFIGDVRARRVDEFLEVDRLRVQRWPNQQPRDAQGVGNVRGAVRGGSGELLGFRCDRLHSQWDREGEPERLTLEGNSEATLGEQSMSAAIIRVARGENEHGTWDVEAEGSVVLRGDLDGQPTLLRSARLEAELDAEMEIRSARAIDRVEMEAPGTRAEADWATLVRRGEEAEVRLFAARDRKARLSRDQTRVAAERITTDNRGSRLVAENDVESTLLGEASDNGTGGLFRADEAVHFVSDRLESTETGGHLVFTGSVRGWQGERNLSAERVTLDQQARTMSAVTNVTNRFPRDPEGATASASEYIQIVADRLDYDDGTRQAVYQGAVRVQVAEGWLEALRIEIDLGEEGQGIREMRAYDEVSVEFRSGNEENEPPQVVAGKADRLTYFPGENLIRFFGDKEPASARRVGLGETTTGRVLGYHLDTGALEVESGAVKTSEQPR
jgi:lipopolysaccharide transport protein LptA